MRVLITMMVLLGFSLAGSVAHADKCKDVRIKINNNSSRNIKVAAFKFYDQCDNKWRTEDVSNSEITKGSSKTFTENLAYVQSCELSSFEVKYAPEKSTGVLNYDSYRYSNGMQPTEGTHVRCETGKTYELNFDDSDMEGK